MTRGILVGYDPQHRGEDALELGRIFADVLGARLQVVTAMPWPNQVESTVSGQQQVERLLADDFDLVQRKLPDLEASARAVVGSSPAATLNEIAGSDPGIRLIVLGSAHRGPIGRTLLGSVGQSLMNGAPCAVAVAPSGYAERDRHTVQHIAVAYDGSDESRAALETAAGMAARCRASITLLADADYPHYGYGTTWSVLTTGELAYADRSDKKRILEEADRLLPNRLERDARLLIGHAGARLAEASGEFDLMVIGSRGYGPLKSTLLGSTSRKLIHSAACPVLVLPRGAGPDPLGMEG